MIGRIVGVHCNTMWLCLCWAWKSRVTSCLRYIILSWGIIKVQLKEVTNQQEVSFFSAYVAGNHGACQIHLGEPHSC
jgi:hypothetical protein